MILRRSSDTAAQRERVEKIIQIMNPYFTLQAVQQSLATWLEKSTVCFNINVMILSEN